MSSSPMTLIALPTPRRVTIRRRSGPAVSISSGGRAMKTGAAEATGSKRGFTGPAIVPSLMKLRAA